MARWHIGIGSDECAPAMLLAGRALSPAARAALHRGAAQPLLGLVRRHLAALAQSRHATAERLGAAPTGALGDAARRSHADGDADSVTVTVPGPMFARAFRDVRILPRAPRKALAIPIHRWAYGVSPREWEARRGSRGPLVRIGRTLAAKVGGQKRGAFTPMYALVPSVMQRQDRSLLPSDSELAAAAREGMAAVIRAAIGRARKGA